MPEQVQTYGRQLTPQQRDERRQDNSDKERLVRQHPSYLLRLLTREQEDNTVSSRQRFELRHFVRSWSNFPRALREAHDAHVYT